MPRLISGKTALVQMPGFNARANSQQDLTTTQTLPFAGDSGSPQFDVLGNYDTGTYRFTVPVSGVYLIGVSAYQQNDNTSGFDINITIDGSVKGEIRNFKPDGDHNEYNGSWVWYLTKGQLVDARNEQPNIHMNSTMSQFYVYFLG